MPVFVSVTHVLQPYAARRLQRHWLALLVERTLLKLHKPLRGREHGDEGRHKTRKASGRALDAVDELEESRHATEAQRVCRHAHGRPQESHEVTQGKADVQNSIAEDREHRALHHLMPQHALRPLKAIHHRGLALQGLYEHAVLNSLLERALHARILGANVLCQFAHTIDIHLAEPNEHRQDGHGDKSQHGVHGEEIAERANKHGKHRQGVWYGLGEEVDDIGDVKLQAVEHVARMEVLLAMPARAENAVEHALLHAVLGADAKKVLHPRAADVEQEVAKNQQTHDSHRPIEVSTRGTTRHVDGMAHGRDLGKRHHDRRQAYHGVKARLQPIAAPGTPKPTQDVSGLVFRTARLESLMKESRHDRHHSTIIHAGRLPT